MDAGAAFRGTFASAKQGGEAVRRSSRDADTSPGYRTAWFGGRTPSRNASRLNAAVSRREPAPSVRHPSGSWGIPIGACRDPNGEIPAFAGMTGGGARSRLDRMATLASVFSREGGSPEWAPAFAGKHRVFLGLCLIPRANHPGGGRGPVGGLSGLAPELRYRCFPNWAPAFAGVGVGGGGAGWTLNSSLGTVTPKPRRPPSASGRTPRARCAACPAR